MIDFKIAYKNGDKQTLQAETYKLSEKFFVFLDENGPVLTVPSDSVESISRGDVPARETYVPFVA